MSLDLLVVTQGKSDFVDPETETVVFFWEWYKKPHRGSQVLGGPWNPEIFTVLQQAEFR